MTAAAKLTESLKGDWHSSYGTACCPAHEDRRHSLSIRDGEKGVLIKCFSGCSQAEIITALRNANLWPVDHPAACGPARRCASAAQRREFALRLWRESRAIRGTVAEAYLRWRAITLELPLSLRCHPRVKHRPTGLEMPAMVAAIQHADRSVIAVQRTYLRADGEGKAAVSAPKMTIAPMGAGAVRLAAAGAELGIAEGIETGLSAMQMFGVPTWCAIGGERLAKLDLPETVRAVVIFGDVGGEAKAYAARDAYRKRGFSAEVRFPTIGKDFNDELRGERPP